MNNSKIESLKNEIRSLDEIIPLIQSKITGDDIKSLISKEFFGEYKRLLELIIEVEDLTDEKIGKLISVINSLKDLARIKTESNNQKIDEITKVINLNIDNITANNYSIWAPTYNKFFYQSEVQSLQLEIKRILKFIDKNIDTNKSFHILDIGTGTGFPSLLLSRVYKNIHINAFDNSEKMLEMAQVYEKEKIWAKDELSITGLMQEFIDKGNYRLEDPNKINFVHSPIVNVERESIDICVMATAIPSYTPYTQELVKSIYDSLKPGGKAMINFSYMSLPRFILLVRDYGWRKARAEYKKKAVIDIILEPTENDKKVFSFKITFPRSMMEKILKETGFRIINTKSIFPLSYLLLSLGQAAVRKDKSQIRAPYMYFKLPRNVFEKVLIKTLMSIDNFLAQWPLVTGYELHYEVEKSSEVVRYT